MWMTETLFNAILIFEWILLAISFYKRISLEKKLYGDVDD